MPKEKGRSLIASNRKARHDYLIDDTFEAGIVLSGTEVKALRMGRASLVDGFAMFTGDELYLENVHIPEYLNGTWNNHAPRRKRKLLLHRAELDEDRAQDPRERAHHRAAVALLQGRPRQGRDRDRHRQEGVRQAACPARAPGQREADRAMSAANRRR